MDCYSLGSASKMLGKLKAKSTGRLGHQSESETEGETPTAPKRPLFSPGQSMFIPVSVCLDWLSFYVRFTRTKTTSNGQPEQ